MTEPLTANTQADVAHLVRDHPGAEWRDVWVSEKMLAAIRRGFERYRRSLRRTRRHGARRGVWRRPTASRRSK